jgi:cytochrome c55X
MAGPWLIALAATGLPQAASAADAADTLVSPQRQQALVRIVRQDCGACHGMRLTGGLGPALTPQALADKPLASLAATVIHGRPGTPMPAWQSMLSEADAQWIARQLLAGFPEEPKGSR